MAGLISTGIAGFLSSAKFTGKQIANKAGKLVPEVVSTFVSGLSGWMMTAKGDLECRSVYARDKFITNEYVYNRIRVTEDEEIISGSMKILSAINNENGTWTVYPDLREGDVNPLANGDLLQGYYHAPGSTGTVYAIQRFTATSNPGTEDQSITIVCEKDCIPYQHMIIVRVGNTTNVDRQSFIRISSRTNCQYFYDEIASFADLDNPDKVKCAIGKADPGLIPAWAAKAIGNVKRWFGLIADGVILRGTFILQSSNKTVESELEGVNTTITDIETRFEVKEGQIAASVKTAESYAKTAVDNANSANEAANAAHGALTGVKESEAIILLTSKGIESKVSEIRKEVDNATGVLQDISEKESSINQTAEGINTKVSEVKVYSESAAASASAAAGSATAAESAKTISVEKSAEAKQTADGFQNTVTEVTKKAVADAVAGADAVIEEKVSTQVTQSAREWKVEVMGADADGNPNTVIAAINATPEGIEIEGKKVKITGELLAEIIKASGLNINDKFYIYPSGEVLFSGAFIQKKQVITPENISNFLKKWNNEWIFDFEKLSEIIEFSGEYQLQNGDYNDPLALINGSMQPFAPLVILPSPMNYTIWDDSLSLIGKKITFINTSNTLMGVTGTTVGSETGSGESHTIAPGYTGMYRCFERVYGGVKEIAWLRMIMLSNS